MMKRRFGPILIALGLLCGTCAWAQNDTSTPDTGEPTQPGPKPAYTYPDATPSLDFLNGSVENSSITLGVGSGFSYDSYGYPSANSRQGRWSFYVTPSIAIQQFRPKVSWNLHYSPGLQLYTQPGNSSYNTNNRFTQGAGAGFLWQFAPHWQMQGGGNYTHSSDPFASYLTQTGAPTQNNPTPVSYYPLTTFTQAAAYLTLSTQLTKVDTLAFTGTYNLRETNTYNLATTVPFYNLTSYAGTASYSHRMSPRLTLGGAYNYQSLDFGRGIQRSGIQVMEFTADYLIRPNMSISGWIGPEYTSTKTVLGIPILGQTFYFTNHDSLWSTALGVNFAWQGLRNSFRAGFTRQVSDGGGITATSQVNSFNVSYRRMFTTKMDLTLGARYTNVLSVTTSSRNFNNYSFNAGLHYKLARSLSATAQYAYTYQSQSNAFLLGSSTYNDNRVGASINYSWTHPLGR